MEKEKGVMLLVGSRVVQTASGYTGEIYKAFEWGVQVWNLDRGNERENWTWSMVTVRNPRSIKRYPRPLRFPRDVHYPVCHCKIGRMEVIGENKVKCARCKNLIGSESFPRRIQRATQLLRREASQRPKKQDSKRVERRKQKVSRPRKTRKAARRVGVRRPSKKVTRRRLLRQPAKKRKEARRRAKTKRDSTISKNRLLSQAPIPVQEVASQTVAEPKEKQVAVAVAVEVNSELKKENSNDRKSESKD